MESLSNDIQQESMKLKRSIYSLGRVFSDFYRDVFSFRTFSLIIAYIAAGIYLNRRVLRKLIEWHPVHNTIDNVSSAKLGFFLLWPIRYFFLFMRLGITKVL